MADRLTVTTDFSELYSWLGEIAERFTDQRPLRGKIVGIMRRGPGSISQQFAQETAILTTGARRRWAKLKPATIADRIRQGHGAGPILERTGAYKRAWLGQGAGAFTRITRKTWAVGVNPGVFPQVRVFQGARTVRGVKPRPVRVSKQVIERSLEASLQFVATGARK